MTNEQLDNLEKDINEILEHNFYDFPTYDLLNIVLREDVLELIKFARRVNEVLPNKEYYFSVGLYAAGYTDAVNQLKREIYDSSNG